MKIFRLILFLTFIWIGSGAATKAQVISVLQLRDVKESDRFYPALKNLIENHKAFESYSDNTFRADQSLTRGEFAKQLYIGLKEKLKKAQKINPRTLGSDLATGHNGGGAAWDISKIKDVSPNSGYYSLLRVLMDEYLIDLTDKEAYFRPDATVSEKELFDWISDFFKATSNAQFSPTRVVTRGDWVIVMSQAFDSLSDKVNAVTAPEKTGNNNQTKILPSVVDVDLPRYQTAYGSRETLLDSFGFLEMGLDRESLLTRAELVRLLRNCLNDLIEIAAWKMKFKNKAEYFEFVKNRPGYAVNFRYSASGVFSDVPIKRFKDVPASHSYYSEFKELGDLVIDICDTKGFCRPEQNVSAMEFYEWLGKIFGIGSNNKSSVSNQPMIRSKIPVPLTDALTATVGKIKMLARLYAREIVIERS